MAAELLGDADPILRARLGSETLDGDALLRLAAPTITTLWLNDAIRRCLAPPPQLANTDGDPLEFMTLHYRIVPAASQTDVVAALSRVPDLRSDDDGAHWTLFAPEPPSKKGDHRKRPADPEAGRTVHASLSLENGVLKALVNSEARAARLRSLLDPALARLVREPLVERVTPEQAMAAHGASGTPTPPHMPEGVDPAALRKALHEMLDRQYRKALGEPVPTGRAKQDRQAGGSQLAKDPGDDQRPAPGRRPHARLRPRLDVAGTRRRRPADLTTVAMFAKRSCLPDNQNTFVS
jgi:hypothetical protein